MSNLISEITPLKGMQRAGFVVSTQTAEGAVLYGIFGTREEAHAWAKNFDNAVSITPVYQPSWNRG